MHGREGIVVGVVSEVRLEGLQFLNLAGNQLGGSLTVKSAESLTIGTADLVFPVFAELSKLKKLQQLYLGSNFFSGMLPVEIGLLSSLRTLDLSTNKLQGSIPHSLENLPSLVKLSIGDNHLIGSIPQEISKLQNLERLDISNNSLSGKECSENPKLCGHPRKKCSQLQQEDKENEEKISRWVGDKPVLCACIALGFIVGFSGVLWFLFLSKKWRFVWFKAMDGPFHRVFCGHE
ncbi:probably inactive leucine-rich repeat receptor-like protein kinase At2g25790 [Amborella trichopoda]|uniref:probably inactive leucine-rich repeat receptor-like protein kinase At2g25790 n=1 Tax=Amborella trichopoda TaxID=13333 RepID=UPI0005D32B48|nr:probably inactive leucine-rich repeat receptor-like protein kinase At2g25790 [Amborella trichopoda]|eukprot:XP_011622034.1 probably inactive leucine-rich repeat receptor-like protein kinase At2g25790 [Amborella trichopoda]